MNYSGDLIYSSVPLLWLGHGVEYVFETYKLMSILIFVQLLTYALGHMAGIGGYSGWRWIFIIEGLATVILAIPSKFLIVDWPEKAAFLNDEQRHLLFRRLDNDVAEARMDRLDSKAKRRAFGDWKILVGYVLIPILLLNQCVANETEGSSCILA